MTMIEAMGRIDQIRASLVELTRPGHPAADPAHALAGAAATGGDFASTLAATVGTGATQPGAAPANPGAATGAAVVADALKYLGVSYVFGGEDASGMDCSGLVQRVYADVGIDLPRLVSGQMKAGTEVGSLADAQPGDLIVTGGGEHILIYAGDHKVIHAPYEGRTVSLVEAYMDDSDIDTIRRIIPSGASPASAPSMLRGAAGGTDLLTSALTAALRSQGMAVTR